MRLGRVLIPFFAGIAACVQLTSAQEFRSIDQWPGMVPQDAPQVTIANVGTVALSIEYLDGAWKTIQIPSRQVVTLPAQDGLSVAFNDGVEAKSVTLNRGTTYALYLNPALNRWTIAPYDEVVKPSGFRSQ